VLFFFFESLFSRCRFFFVTAQQNRESEERREGGRGRGGGGGGPSNKKKKTQRKSFLSVPFRSFSRLLTLFFFLSSSSLLHSPRSLFRLPALTSGLTPGSHCKTDQTFSQRRMFPLCKGQKWAGGLLLVCLETNKQTNKKRAAPRFAKGTPIEWVPTRALQPSSVLFCFCFLFLFLKRKKHKTTNTNQTKRAARAGLLTVEKYFWV